MSYIIINSVFVVIIFAALMMAIFLIGLAYKISKDEQRMFEEEMKRLQRDNKYDDIFDQTNLKK